MPGCPCNVTQKKLLTPPKASPSISPRSSPKTENLKESPNSSLKELVSSNNQETGPGVLGKSSNAEPNQSDVAKADISTSNSKEKEKKKKKSSWFNSFYPTYKSRSEDFKRIFKEVPDDERLVVDYSCAVQKEILVHGRLYVTQNYLCFHANIFGWETNIVLKWKDVSAITKEKTALVIPNAILISTKSDRYFFTSFVARDKVYLMLFRVWQNVLMDRQMSNQEMWKWVHQSYGAELGLTSDDEDYIAPGSDEGKLLPSKNSSDSLPETEDNSTDLITDLQEENMKELDGKESTNNVDQVAEAHKNTDMSETDFSEIEAEPDAQNVFCTNAHDGRQLLNETLPINVDQLFTLLFTSSKFFLDFHASRKNTDLVLSPWTLNSADNSKTRTVNLTVALSQPIGPKSCQVTEIQTMLPCSKAGMMYSITTESTNAGIPYADSFNIEAHICLRKVSDTKSSLSVFADVKFKKSLWGIVRGMIEKNCWSGLEEFYVSLSKTLQTVAEDYIPDVKRKTRRKRKTQVVPSLETKIPPLGPVMEIRETAAVLTTEKAMFLIFGVLLLLLILNLMLYSKLWALEEQPVNNIMNFKLLKNLPSSNEEWLKLVQMQDELHSKEVIKWQELLRKAIDSLGKAEQLLQTLQESTSRRAIRSDFLDDSFAPSTDRTPREL